MDYKIEELVPIVGTLAGKYTAYESTSITYEQAEQLMEAVLYCIRESEQYQEGSMIPAAGIPARKAYETGLAYVEEKTRKALALYDSTLTEFYDYGNRCLYDTFVSGLPKFFARYDIRFAPQDTIILLNYPVLKDLSAYTGIDRIYEFIRCVHLEQTFLNLFPRDYVLHILSNGNGQYDQISDNVCEAVLLSVAGHILAGKPLEEADLEDEDGFRIGEIIARTDLSGLCRQLENAISQFTGKYGDDDRELTEYLSGGIRNIALRLKNAIDPAFLYPSLAKKDDCRTASQQQ